MNKVSKRFIYTALSISMLSFFSCSTSKMYDKVVPLKEPCSVSRNLEDYLYFIEGTDKNGKPANVYILGTLHIGDENLYPLSENIGYCYVNSDKLVGELSSEDYDRIDSVMNDKINVARKNEMERISNDGKPLSELITDEQKEFLLQFIPKLELERLYKYEPWVLELNISQIPMVLANMSNSYGIDYSLYKLAEADNRHVEGLDTIDTQMNIVSGESFDKQFDKLNQYITYLQNNLDEATNNLTDTYNAYISHDDDELYRLTFSDLKGEEMSKRSKEYKDLVLNRNIDWADKIASYIYEGGNTFVFVGVSHLLGDDSVFEIMLKKGYVKEP